MKIRPGGKHYGFEHVRKYHDSILYCAKLAKVDLPRGYASEMKAFLKTLKKEKATAKREGQIDEQDADEIPWTLFEAICNWALASGNVMVWCSTAV